MKKCYKSRYRLRNTLVVIRVFNMEYQKHKFWAVQTWFCSIKTMPQTLRLIEKRTQSKIFDILFWRESFRQFLSVAQYKLVLNVKYDCHNLVSGILGFRAVLQWELCPKFGTISRYSFLSFTGKLFRWHGGYFNVTCGSNKNNFLIRKKRLKSSNNEIEASRHSSSSTYQQV